MVKFYIYETRSSVSKRTDFNKGQNGDVLTGWQSIKNWGKSQFSVMNTHKVIAVRIKDTL